MVMHGWLTARGVLAGAFVLRCSHDFSPVFPALLTIVECLLCLHFLHPSCLHRVILVNMWVGKYFH